MAQADEPFGKNMLLQSDRDNQIVDETLLEFAQLQTWRYTFASHWEEVARLILPTSRNTFMYGNFNWPGMKKTQEQVDASGAMALSRFSAILDSLLTPRSMKWHGLASSDPTLMKDREVRLWFEQATELLFKFRYAPIGNFSSQNSNNYTQLGAFGTTGMFVDQAVGEDGTPLRALRYKSVPLGELYIRENHQGLVNGFIRHFRLTADQAYKMFGAANFPEILRPALEQKSGMYYDFLHRVCPRNDYDPQDIGYKGKPFASYYISMQGRILIREGGYYTFPLSVSRYEQTPGEIYGRSPAMMVLPALKTLNAMKRTYLKQAHRSADPVLLTADDGVVGMDMRPGALNPGGVNQEGKLLVQALPTGNMTVALEMMEPEHGLIKDAFLVSLFQILEETPTMTATEVIERVNEKGILMAPTVGRQQSEYLGPMIDRELDLLMQMGLLPPMPQALQEARGNYEVIYTSPLSKAMRAQDAAGFMRTVESVKELVNITQDASLLDRFDFDTAVPAIADIQGVPESWMSDDAAVLQKRKARAQAAARQEQIQAAPAAAAMMKAQAAVQKAGGGASGQAQAPAPPVPIVGSQSGGQ